MIHAILLSIIKTCADIKSFYKIIIEQDTIDADWVAEAGEVGDQLCNSLKINETVCFAIGNGQDKEQVGEECEGRGNTRVVMCERVYELHINKDLKLGQI